MTRQAVEITQSFRGRRAAGGALIVIALPLILIWLRFGPPMQFRLGDMLFVIGGPGLLLLGLWAVFPRGAPQVRMTIGDEVLRVTVRGVEKVIALDQLVSVQWRYIGRHNDQRLIFKTTDSTINFEVVRLTHEAQDIIRLIAIRLENRGKFMREGRARITGAPDGIWTVKTGNPF